ncbi:cation transporter [Duganella fentianensis]|nr:cation transporter [Duganella fentianensis]
MNTNISLEAVEASTADRHRSILSVPKMDCPSEENLIRLALAPISGISTLKFDLGAHTVTIEHVGAAESLVDALAPLNFGAQLRESRKIEAGEHGVVLSTIAIPKMDCPSEENLIRMALADTPNISALQFDLAGRQLRVTHTGDAEALLERLTPLGLGAELTSTERADTVPAMQSGDDAGEARTLRWLLSINGTMFLVEMIWGWLSQSTGLISDSLDMFADAAVYVLALFAVGRSLAHKRRAAHLAGWLQLVLAIGAIAEVIRHGVSGSEPESVTMMGIGAVALVANIACLILIAKKRDHGAHMKASYIFSANDVIANLGVIIAGALVTWTGSRYPDLIIGLIIGVIVLGGARRILRLQ